MKRSAAFLLTLLMLARLLTGGVFAAEQTMTISLRIEGLEKNHYYNDKLTVKHDGKLTVNEAVKQVLDAKNYTETSGQFGVYFSQLFGEVEYSATTYSGWNYVVNNQSPPVSSSAFELTEGDEVVFYFGDMNTLVPTVSHVKTESGRGLKFTAASWDADWNPVTVPVGGVSVTWGGKEIGKTDEKGVIALPQDASAVGETYSLAYLKQGESFTAEGGASGVMPAVLRPASDLKIALKEIVEFSDLPRDNWAGKYVYDLAERGTIKGKGDGMFHPADLISGWEVALMLGKPEMSSDRTPITREGVADMLAQFLGDKLKKAETCIAYEDDDDITSKDAVYNLTAAGIFAGRDGNNFAPTANLRRDEAARLVWETLEINK